MNLPHPIRSVIDATVAEFFGTAILALMVSFLGYAAGAGYAVSGFEPLFMPFGVGLTLFLLIATLGYASGGHFNPAVSLALVAARRFNARKLLYYLPAQFLGALVGVACARFIIPGGLPAPLSQVTTSGAFTEFLGAVIFGLAVLSVVIKRVRPEHGPAVIGIGLALGVSLAYAFNGGLLNPALALGMGAWSWHFWVMPVLGVLAGGSIAVLFDEESDPQPAGS